MGSPAPGLEPCVVGTCTEILLTWIYSQLIWYEIISDRGHGYIH